VLGGEGGAAGHEVGGRALKDDSAAVAAGPRAEVDDPVGVGHDRRWCSMTITDRPESTRRSRRPRSCSTSARCRPEVGSSRM
jgi:hypothetical protein